MRILGNSYWTYWCLLLYLSLINTCQQHGYVVITHRSVACVNTGGEFWRQQFLLGCPRQNPMAKLSIWGPAKGAVGLCLTRQGTNIPSTGAMPLGALVGRK